MHRSVVPRRFLEHTAGAGAPVHKSVAPLHFLEHTAGVGAPVPNPLDYCTHLQACMDHKPVLSLIPVHGMRAALSRCWDVWNGVGSGMLYRCELGGQ